jgi:hypothetical protein
MTKAKEALIEHLAIINMRHAASKDRVFHFWFEYKNDIAQALQLLDKVQRGGDSEFRFVSRDTTDKIPMDEDRKLLIDIIHNDILREINEKYILIERV